MKKTIVILARSIKNHQLCIAGKDLDTKEWIRPVSNIHGAAITREQCRLTFEGAGYTWDSKVLHNAEIEFVAHRPLYYQPENYEIAGSQWLQRYNSDIRTLFTLLDFPDTLWGSSSNRVSTNLIKNGVSASLYLIQVKNLYLYINQYGKRKVDFAYNGIQYTNFSCTDPNVDFLRSKSERYNNAILCLSLGELFPQDNCHYKIVASIFC